MRGFDNFEVILRVFRVFESKKNICAPTSIYFSCIVFIHKSMVINAI